MNRVVSPRYACRISGILRVYSNLIMLCKKPIENNRIMHIQKVFSLLFSLVLVVFLSACEKELFSPASGLDTAGRSTDVRGNGNGGGGGNGGGNNGGKKDKGTDEEPIPEEETTFTGITYKTENFNPENSLYQFTINDAGDQVLFESNPVNEEIGTDLFGFWADPFAFDNNQVISLGGLSDFTWDFTLQSDGVSYSVVETQLTRNEFDLSDVTITVTELGIYRQQ